MEGPREIGMMAERARSDHDETADGMALGVYRDTFDSPVSAPSETLFRIGCVPRG